MLKDIEEMRQERLKHKAVVITNIPYEYYLVVVVVFPYPRKPGPKPGL